MRRTVPLTLLSALCLQGFASGNEPELPVYGAPLPVRERIEPLPVDEVPVPPEAPAADPWKAQQGKTLHLRPNAAVRAAPAKTKPNSGLRASTASAEISREISRRSKSGAPLNESDLLQLESDILSKAPAPEKPVILKRIVLLDSTADLDSIPDDQTVLEPIVDMGVHVSETEREILATHLGAVVTSPYLRDLPQELYTTLKNLGRPLRGLVLIRCDKTTGEVILRIIP